MTGRNEIATTLGTNVTLLVQTYRREYNYPSWFENTLGYAESGQISALALQQAANNLLNQGHMIRKPIYTNQMDSERVREIIEDYHGDDINLLHSNVSHLGTQMTKSFDLAQSGREANQANITANTGKIEELFSGQKNIYDSISQKSDKGHTHANGGKEKCPWYDIGCQMQEGFEGLGKLALIGGVAIVGIWLLKMRLGK
tara:strand:- start:229 stop:828 length:600 start_codon:yes stop_codon:yes gene_type:complete